MGRTSEEKREGLTTVKAVPAGSHVMTEESETESMSMSFLGKGCSLRFPRGSAKLPGKAADPEIKKEAGGVREREVVLSGRMSGARDGYKLSGSEVKEEGRRMRWGRPLDEDPTDCVIYLVESSCGGVRVGYGARDGYKLSGSEVDEGRWVCWGWPLDKEPTECIVVAVVKLCGRVGVELLLWATGREKKGIVLWIVMSREATSDSEASVLAGMGTENGGGGMTVMKAEGGGRGFDSLVWLTRSPGAAIPGGPELFCCVRKPSMLSSPSPNPFRPFSTSCHGTSLSAICSPSSTHVGFSSARTFMAVSWTSCKELLLFGWCVCIERKRRSRS
mmetsp:Transcript_4834/g.10091  ORF Transcript_4834/g.10091 Transcript_4834/m.10091 type:complete len:332 (-) Transcript_4834:119-1114(-)